VREKMAGNKNKIEKEYRTLENEIERKAEEEIEDIRERANQIRKEAENIGRDVELSISESETKATKKKG